MKNIGIYLPLFALALSCAVASLAQDDTAREAMESEFYFARVAFGVHGGRFGGGRDEPWLRDWPEAEHHFMQGVRRLTRIDAARDNRQVNLTDDAIFEYPVIYAVKVGYWHLGDEEASRLREYLLRGGFLIVDDFHGPYEWAQFSESLQRVFRDRPIVDIPGDDEIFHVLYDLDQRVQIPGSQAVRRGVTWEHPQGATDPAAIPRPGGSERSSASATGRQ